MEVWAWPIVVLIVVVAGMIIFKEPIARLIDRIRNGTIGADETVLFWHTGGTPALFAYPGELGRSPPRIERAST